MGLGSRPSCFGRRDEIPRDWVQYVSLTVSVTPRSKFTLKNLGRSWLRSVTHYMFLADPRTLRVIGEPKKSNAAIIRTSQDAGMHLQTVSVTWNFMLKDDVHVRVLHSPFISRTKIASWRWIFANGSSKRTCCIDTYICLWGDMYVYRLLLLSWYKLDFKYPVLVFVTFAMYSLFLRFDFYRRRLAQSPVEANAEMDLTECQMLGVEPT